MSFLTSMLGHHLFMMVSSKNLGFNLLSYGYLNLAANPHLYHSFWYLYLMVTCQLTHQN